MTHLKVAVRIRPLSHREVETESTQILSVDDNKTISITNVKVPEQNAGDSRERIRRFTFDFCFQENSTQEQVFQAVEGVVGQAIKERYHCCVLAYGQSSTGKTHTMMGFPHDPGLIPRLCQGLFGYFQETAVGDEGVAMKANVSYLEIYNEKVRDLLVKSPSNVPLKVRQHPKKGPYVQGLSEHSALEPAALLQLLETGNSNRRIASTLTNPKSSRSHAVFLINCCDVKLTLVDLAGSERTGSRCYSASRFREGANINKSLVALGNVISALAEYSCRSSRSARRRFIPYRDSILTWLLKDTLGGNSNTFLIATISPSSACYSETVNTLRFGQRAKLIVSTPVVNEDPREKTIRELRAEILRLKQLLLLQQTSNQLNPIPMLDDNRNDNELEDIAPSKDSTPACQATEKLIPLMNTSASVNKEIKPTPRLRRTFSVDQTFVKMQKPNPPHFSSQETIKRLRRPSMDKTNKLEKTIITEVKSLENVRSKIDSLRRPSANKPRAQIVAAVTNRLYAKNKKKDASTDTSDINKPPEPPKELTICSNARLRLKELTKKALKAHRMRNGETQTDLFPVIRVKEISTDVDDLKIELDEIRHIAIGTITIEMCDKSVDCCLIENFDGLHHYKNTFLITNSCGSQTNETNHTQKETSNVSFTKYLRNPEITTTNPIYTNSVNINVTHNYLNHQQQQQQQTDNVSDDSLEEQNRENVCFPTPDLISNHNSLEQHAILTSDNKENTELKMKQSDLKIIQDDYEILEEFSVRNLENLTPIWQILPVITKQLDSINIPELYAPEIVITGNYETLEYFTTIIPTSVKPAIVQIQPIYYDDCIKIIEPLVLKSIMKHYPESKRSDSSNESSDNELADSLEYHMINNNKKVRFTQTHHCQNERMLKAMSGFLEEATVLMNNLTTIANQFERPFDEFDVRVTINELTGLQKSKKHRKSGKKKERKHANCQTDSKISPVNVTNTCTQCPDDVFIPVNKYEALLEDSCRRLEEKLHKETATRPNHYEDHLNDFNYNPWDLSLNDNEDTSIDSNPVTFSDYGSLPRQRRTLRKSRPSCSPSAFLRQLTNMRRQVVESTRDELYNNTQ